MPYDLCIMSADEAKHPLATKVSQPVSGSSYAQWRADPVSAHESWRKTLRIADRPYADHSNALYCSLFARFCSWLKANDLDLVTVSEVDIGRFVDGLRGRNNRPANSRTQRSYVAEIDRVMGMLQSIGFRADNPAREVNAMMHVTTPMKPRAILSVSVNLRDRYEAHISGIDPGQVPVNEVRDHAMAMLMLDGGLTLKEVQKLTLADVDRPEVAEDGAVTWTVRAPGHRSLQSRSVPLSEQGIRWMSAWVECRASLRVVSMEQYQEIAGALHGLYADRRSKAISEGLGGRDEGKDAPMTHRHLSRAFVTLAGKSNRAMGMRGAGLAINRVRDEDIQAAAARVFDIADPLIGTVAVQGRRGLRSPQTLRNLFGAELLSRGVSDAEVAQRMGLMGLDQIWALKRTAMFAPVLV